MQSCEFWLGTVPGTRDSVPGSRKPKSRKVKSNFAGSVPGSWKPKSRKVKLFFALPGNRPTHTETASTPGCFSHLPGACCPTRPQTRCPPRRRLELGGALGEAGCTSLHGTRRRTGRATRACRARPHPPFRPGRGACLPARPRPARPRAGKAASGDDVEPARGRRARRVETVSYFPRPDSLPADAEPLIFRSGIFRISELRLPWSPSEAWPAGQTTGRAAEPAPITTAFEVIG